MQSMPSVDYAATTEHERDRAMVRYLSKAFEGALMLTTNYINQVNDSTDEATLDAATESLLKLVRGLHQAASVGYAYLDGEQPPIPAGALDSAQADKLDVPAGTAVMMNNGSQN